MTARAGVGVPSSARAESPAEGLAMDWMRLAGSAGWARSTPPSVPAVCRARPYSLRQTRPQQRERSSRQTRTYEIARPIFSSVDSSGARARLCIPNASSPGSNGRISISGEPSKRRCGIEILRENPGALHRNLGGFQREAKNYRSRGRQFPELREVSLV